MDRFTRFKLLRALWARAKNLLAWLYGPRARDERLRALRWQQMNVAERLMRDGVIRGTGDPDSYVVPPGTSPRGVDEYARRAHIAAQREWYRAAQEWDQQQRQQQRQQGRR
jgi:hypothetical protein